MLRITIHRSDNVVTLELEGKLAADWVKEASDTWKAISSSGPRSIHIDLSAVTFVDSRGRGLLSDMHANGVHLTGSTLVTRGLIEEITS